MDSLNFVLEKQDDDENVSVKELISTLLSISSDSKMDILIIDKEGEIQHYPMMGIMYDEESGMTTVSNANRERNFHWGEKPDE